ncbi:MAG TPA: CsbD family protein [Micavibrio sp.]
MNKDIFEGNWKQLKGDVQKKWGKLTNDHLDQIEGSREKLAGVIQENYGVARQEAEKQIAEWEKTRVRANDRAA